MGADLIGYFAKGPRTLSTQAFAAAVAEADRRLAWLRRAEAHLELDNDTKLIELLAGCPWAERDAAHVPPEQIDTETLRIEIARLCDMVGSVEELTGEQAVKQFVESWPPLFRDAAHVVDPDCPDKLIVFAGERTWGDTPDGAGFQLLSRAGVLGIAPILGVWVEAAFMTLHIPSLERKLQ